jgi:26S proteasome regulatory subunit N11
MLLLMYISGYPNGKIGVVHGRAGVPIEVKGLMIVDDYTINCVNVFAMSQSRIGVSIEAVDPVFQMKILDMLKHIGRPEEVVGWYHSHPGFTMLYTVVF